MPEQIDPVVVHGHGRTGTTLLVRLLGLHPHLAWFSQYHGRWPGHPSVAALSRLADVDPLRRRYGTRRWFPQPAEAIQAWERHFPGFHDNRPDFAAEGTDDRAVERFRHEVDRSRRWQGKPGFLTKYTGYPRYEFVQKALPGVRIVHLDRDPRAVVMSVVKQRWGYKKDPEGWAALSPTARIDLAADRYLRWSEEVERSRPGQGYRRVHYEDLTADADRFMAALLEWLGLPRLDAFRRRLDEQDVHGTADSWRAQVGPEEQAHLESRLAPVLQARRLP